MDPSHGSLFCGVARLTKADKRMVPIEVFSRQNNLSRDKLICPVSNACQENNQAALNCMSLCVCCRCKAA